MIHTMKFDKIMLAWSIAQRNKKGSSSQMERGSWGATPAGRTLGGADGMSSWTRRKPLSSLYCRRHTLFAFITGHNKHIVTKSELVINKRARFDSPRKRMMRGTRKVGTAMTMAWAAPCMHQCITWKSEKLEMRPRNHITLSCTEKRHIRRHKGKYTHFRTKKHFRALSRLKANAASDVPVGAKVRMPLLEGGSGVLLPSPWPPSIADFYAAVQICGHKSQFKRAHQVDHQPRASPSRLIGSRWQTSTDPTPPLLP